MEVEGTHVADIELDLATDEERYILEFASRNEGFLAWLAGKHKTRMRTEAVRTAAGDVLPLSFRARYEKPDLVRDVALDYSGKGALERVSILNDGEPKAPETPPDLQRGTVDPLTTYLLLEDWIEAGPDLGAQIEIPVFDGRKRIDLEARYLGLRRSAEDDLVHYLRVRMTGLFGFEPEDRMVALPGEAPAWLDVYVSAEGRPVPLLVRSADGGRPVEIMLEEGS